MSKNEKNATSVPKVFTFNQSNQPIRVEVINNEPWFVAKDVCMAIAIEKHRDAMSRIDDDERGSVVVDTLGGRQSMTAVNESGLYNLIFQSRKPEAKSFRKWVTSEVLPSIRKTGGYKPGLPKQSYIKRGEGFNTRVMQLLWVVNEYLNQGDRIDIALQLGVTRQSVYNTLSGRQRSGRILHACYERALANREKQNAIYFASEAAYDNLVLGTNNSLRPTLPSEPDPGRRGGQPGNQNSKKGGN
jgi:prophage antirepressor-like protein